MRIQSWSPIIHGVNKTCPHIRMCKQSAHKYSRQLTTQFSMLSSRQMRWPSGLGSYIFHSHNRANTRSIRLKYLQHRNHTWYLLSGKWFQSRLRVVYVVWVIYACTRNLLVLHTLLTLKASLDLHRHPKPSHTRVGY